MRDSSPSWKASVFQPTLPARGATRGRGDLDAVFIVISTHAPRTGSDHAFGAAIQLGDISTHAPRTGSDVLRARLRLQPCNFNPRSPHGERQRLRWRRSREPGISTHAPRTGSDAHPYSRPRRCRRISTHAPRTGSDISVPAFTTIWSYFNPRSPHGERRAADDQRVAAVGISTHAPRTGSDTHHGRNRHPRRDISTHAPRTGSDGAQFERADGHLTISTHAPRTGSD